MLAVSLFVTFNLDLALSRLRRTQMKIAVTQKSGSGCFFTCSFTGLAFYGAVDRRSLYEGQTGSFVALVANTPTFSITV